MPEPPPFFLDVLFLLDFESEEGSDFAAGFDSELDSELDGSELSPSFAPDDEYPSEYQPPPFREKEVREIKRFT